MIRIISNVSNFYNYNTKCKTNKIPDLFISIENIILKSCRIIMGTV